MARLERVSGGMRLQLGADEVDVVASLAEGLVMRLMSTLEDDDDLLAQLAPTASRGDAEVDTELRGLLRDDLMSARVERLRDLARVLRAGSDVSDDGYDRTLDRDEAMRIVEALNDLRLALGATVGYEEVSRAELAPDDQRNDAIRLMDALAWLQGGLIEYVDSD